MSHIIGKVYEVNAANMNKLIAELEAAQKEIQELRDALRKLMKVTCSIHDPKSVYRNQAKEVLAKFEKHKDEMWSDFENASSVIERSYATSLEDENKILRDALSKAEDYLSICYLKVKAPENYMYVRLKRLWIAVQTSRKRGRNELHRSCKKI